MKNKYPLNIGALFKNERRQSEASPVLTGSIELDRALVTHLCHRIESGKSAVLSLGGWKNISQGGKQYFTIKASAKYKARSDDFATDDEKGVFDL